MGQSVTLKECSKRRTKQIVLLVKKFSLHVCPFAATQARRRWWMG
jgi:hypothetical protein